MLKSSPPEAKNPGIFVSFNNLSLSYFSSVLVNLCVFVSLYIYIWGKSLAGNIVKELVFLFLIQLDAGTETLWVRPKVILFLLSVCCSSPHSGSISPEEEDLWISWEPWADRGLMLCLCGCQWLCCRSLKCKFPLSFAVEDCSLSLQPPPCYGAALYRLQEVTGTLSIAWELSCCGRALSQNQVVLCPLVKSSLWL